MSNFSDNLLKWRKEQGFTRADLAQIAGVSTTAIGLYETGEREPKASILQKLAAALHVSIDELLGYEVNNFEACRRMIEQTTISGAPLFVDIDDFDAVRITRGENRLEDVLQFSNKVDFIDFVQGVRRDFLKSRIYANACNEFFEMAIRKERESRLKAISESNELAERMKRLSVELASSDLDNVLDQNTRESLISQLGLASAILQWRSRKPPATAQSVTPPPQAANAQAAETPPADSRPRHKTRQKKTPSKEDADK